MCELFGFSAKEPQKVNQELKEFFSHSNEHPHGWGLALLDKDNFSLEKEPIRAIDSIYLKERVREPIISQAAYKMKKYVRCCLKVGLVWKRKPYE